MYKKLLEHPFIFNLWSATYITPVARMITAVIQQDSQTSILDLGCGSGRLQRHLSFRNYMGIDQNSGYIEYAKKHSQGRFIAGDVTDLNRCLDDQKFDYVFLIGLLHHLEYSQAVSVMKQLPAYVKPGGKVIVIDHVYTPELSLLNKILLKCDRGKFIIKQNDYRQLFQNFTVVSNKGFSIGLGSIALWSSPARFVLTPR